MRPRTSLGSSVKWVGFVDTALASTPVDPAGDLGLLRQQTVSTTVPRKAVPLLLPSGHLISAPRL
jgi:hypothetical protein